LSQLQKQGVIVQKIPCLATGVIELNAAERLVKKEPVALVVCQQGSNVAGCLQPIAELASLAHAAGARMVVDGAQAAGHIPINLEDLGVDAWFCSGHKGLLGPQGIGVLYLKNGFKPAALITGGTGSGSSEWDESCNSEPECFEAGTQPLPLILGLAAALNWLSAKEAAAEASDYTRFLTLLKHEQSLTRHLCQGLLDIPGITVLGPDVRTRRLPLVSFVAEQLASDTIAHRLDTEYGIAVRAGLHCAPDAHGSLGTLSTGAVRISLSHANTLDELDLTLAAIAEIVLGDE
jgi:selenocysteine lyase/cysteine desulfurase